MSREIDAAVSVAHEMTREPKVMQATKAAVQSKAKPKAVKKVPEKVGAPTVRVDKSGHRVRLRNIDHALPVCISTEDGETRVSLEPNKWTVVPDEIYIMLRDKFYKPQTYSVVDWNGDVQNPQRQPRTEEYQEYVIEFPEESD